MSKLSEAANLPCAFCGRNHCPHRLLFGATDQNWVHADIACSLARIAKCLEALEKREGK